ncbi:MAG: glycosyltransferase family 2 protein [Bacteriovorax sp.]
MNEVSIVIPTFNRSELLRNLLRSIKNQSFKNFEVIVVDDNSSDQSKYLEVINEFKRDLNLQYLVNDKGRGAPYSRNRGINLAKANLIALVDDDDEWFPRKLEEQIKMFQESSAKVGLVYTWTKVVDSNRNPLRDQCDVFEGACKSEILDSCFISSPSVMLRKEALVSAGLFDESFPSCQDWDMWTRIIFKGYECRVCKDFLTYYYKHDGPSIGTSPRAKLGFKMYYGKHFFKLVRYFKLRHIVRFIRLSAGL